MGEVGLGAKGVSGSVRASSGSESVCVSSFSQLLGRLNEASCCRDPPFAYVYIYILTSRAPSW